VYLANENSKGETMSDETTTDDKPGLVKKGVALIGLAASTIFLANIPGLPPEIPDITPIVGNIDEVFASALFLWSLRTLGLKPMQLLKGARKKKQLTDGSES
jgi:hypothetical protein